MSNLSPVRRSRGISTVEVLLVLPVLMILLLGMLEFSAILSARQRILAASYAGARVAALGGGQADIEAAVDQILGSGWSSGATIGGDVFEGESGSVDGELDIVRPGEPITVRVRVLAVDVAPDVLRFVGLGLGEHELVVATTMMKE